MDACSIAYIFINQPGRSIAFTQTPCQKRQSTGLRPPSSSLTTMNTDASPAITPPRLPADVMIHVFQLAFDDGICLESNAAALQHLKTLLSLDSVSREEAIIAAKRTIFLVEDLEEAVRVLDRMHPRFLRYITRIKIFPLSTPQRLQNGLTALGHRIRLMKKLRSATIDWPRSPTNQAWIDLFTFEGRHKIKDIFQFWPKTCNVDVLPLEETAKEAIKEWVLQNGEDWSVFERIKAGALSKA